MKQGEILKEFISRSGKTQDEVAILLNFKTRQGLRYHFSHDKLENDLIDRLVEADMYKLFLQFAQKNYPQEYPPQMGDPPTINALLKEVDLLKRETELQKKHIKLLEERHDEIKVKIRRAENYENIFHMALRGETKLEDLQKLIGKGQSSGVVSKSRM